MEYVLKIKDENGNWLTIPAIKGASNYELAVANGYNGTEAEWIELLKPAAKVTKVEDGYFVEIKNGYGTVSFTVRDGKDGKTITKVSELENDEGYLKESSGSGAFVNYGEGYKVNIGASTDVSIASGGNVYLNGRNGTVVSAEEGEIAADFSNQRIANIADPEADTDGANKKYVDDAVKNVSGGGGTNVTVPTKLSELENDVGYVKSEEEYGYIGFTNKGKRAFFEAQDDIAIVSESVHIFTGGKTVLKSNGDGGVALNVSSQRIANLANPINDTDGANKRYVDELIGDVSTALDNIIALQNAKIEG